MRMLKQTMANQFAYLHLMAKHVLSLQKKQLPLQYYKLDLFSLVHLLSPYDSEFNHEARFVLELICRRWEHYSGHPAHPIWTKKDISPYLEQTTTENLWDKNTEYGQLNWCLLEYVYLSTKV